MTRVGGSNDAREKDQKTRVEESLRRCMQNTPDVSQISHNPHSHHPPSEPVKYAAHPQDLLLFRLDRLRRQRLQVLTKTRRVRQHANAHNRVSPCQYSHARESQMTRVGSQMTRVVRSNNALAEVK